MDNLFLPLAFAAALFMTGVLWIVQTTIYPAFAKISPDAFHDYHENYTRRISLVYCPVLLLESITTLWLLARVPTGTPSCMLVYSAAALLALLWLNTFFIHVPIHARLHRAFDSRAHRLLVNTNWFRTVGWSVRSVLLGMLLVGSW